MRRSHNASAAFSNSSSSRRPKPICTSTRRPMAEACRPFGCPNNFVATASSAVTISRSCGPKVDELKSSNSRLARSWSGPMPSTASTNAGPSARDNCLSQWRASSGVTGHDSADVSRSATAWSTPRPSSASTKRTATSAERTLRTVSSRRTLLLPRAVRHASAGSGDLRGALPTPQRRPCVGTENS